MEPKPFVELHTFSVSYWWSVTDIAFYFSDITVVSAVSIRCVVKYVVVKAFTYSFLETNFYL